MDIMMIMMLLLLLLLMMMMIMSCVICTGNIPEHLSEPVNPLTAYV